MAGERQIEQGRAFRAETGSSPNGVANAWLARRRGCGVWVQAGGIKWFGILLGFDSYSILINQFRPDGRSWERLIFKGPGVSVLDKEPLEEIDGGSDE